MKRLSFLLYGSAAYVALLASLLWAIGFIEGVGVPALDAQPPRFTPLSKAVAIDLLLIGAFGVSHSVMARRGFKRGWTSIVPPQIERSTYVVVASLLLAAICRGWQPIEGVIWRLEGTPLRAVQALSLLGWGIVLVSSFLVDHLELYGLRQSWYAFRGGKPPAPTLKTGSLYRFVRHPLYFGFLLAVWAAERMTWSHLLFGAATTAYILVGARLEERDLVATFGEAYRDYQRRVPRLVPFRLGRGGSGTPYPSTS
ncbi:MAG TPA: isoprenylcysteine carboxylmethyltransferase family protein [Planctomycetota bacterium]|jgi:protein-S-isoprenylcysteine O-methyltransferase Ste14|nr:isoprenylcysteine carboxylmethyltransferase family protein [Planctomycetota bacterium]